MGIIKSTGRAAYRETSHIVGGEGIKRWWTAIRISWFSIKRRCPACQEGRLFRFKEAVDGQLRDFYGCSDCDHFEVADLSNAKDRLVVDSLTRLQDLAERKMATMGREAVDAIKRRLRINSRFQYFFSFVLLAFGFYLLAVGGSAWTLLNASALAVLMFAQGLRLSYRHWQLDNMEMFRSGAFRRWIAQGKWLI